MADQFFHCCMSLALPAAVSSLLHHKCILFSQCSCALLVPDVISDCCLTSAQVICRWSSLMMTIILLLLLGRPNVSSEGLMFYCCFFKYFFPPRDLRVPSADRRETLPHDRNMGALYNASPKIRGALPPKKLGAKNMQN